MLQADGGTRTAAITGAYLAARLAVQKLLDARRIPENPLNDSVAAVSVGICGGRELLDLAYVEDKDAEVDCNVVMTGQGRFVEVQGSGEEATFSHEQLQGLLALAQTGLKELAVAAERLSRPRAAQTLTFRGGCRAVFCIKEKRFVRDSVFPSTLP